MTVSRPSVSRTNRRRRDSMLKPRTQLDVTSQLTAGELLERCAAVPSREKLTRRELRADLAENVTRFYDALWRHARATHSSTIYTTWDQLAVANGYEPGKRALHTMQRYAALLAEAGILEFGGDQDDTGAHRRLRVRLLAVTTVR